MAGDIVQSLWIGKRLSVMGRLAVQSFLANGHEFHLYCYEPVAGAPPGTVFRHASEILPRDRVFAYRRGFGQGSYSGGSNFFRYKLLLDRGGWWVDTDVVCLRPFDFSAEHVLASEIDVADAPDLVAASSVMKQPAGSALMRLAWRECRQRDPDQLQWGEVGPKLLNDSMHLLGLEDDVAPAAAFSPIPYFDWKALIDPDPKCSFGPEVYAVHLWHQQWRENKIDPDGQFPPTCLYEQLKRRFLTPRDTTAIAGPARRPAPEAASIPERITAIAKHSPNQLAVADDAAFLSFTDLDEASNRLAWRLQDAGVQSESCVGLFFERSTDFVVAALAVMKCGAAYLPLDTDTPAGRAETILNDAGASVVLTHRGKTRDWPANAWPVIEIDVDAGQPMARPPVAPAPDSLAYLVYTSGTTGQPKGVEITHANLLNLVDWHNTTFGVSAKSRASHVAGLGFDAAVWEIWPHLAAGASLFIADEATRRSPTALRDWLVQHEITIAFVPTAVAEQLVHNEWPAETALRMLLTGADVLHRHPREGLPFTVVNNYGPSECTVVATSGVVTADEAAAGPPSIGRAITGAEVLVLDEQLQPVTTGEPGELCIAGKLVGRGYRDRPELTAEKFVSYVPATGAAVRIYRTGDRARWLPNGELQFMGRLDDQIKIRGYRIEPGEIIAHLERYLGVEAAAVAAIPADAGPVLCAYVVLAKTASVTDVDLRGFLRPRLPEYMIPAHFVRLDELPLTANGKLNKALLPRPNEANRLAGRTAGTASPAMADEDLLTQVTALVAGLLENQSVGPHDNIFLIGGHSMLAAQLVARIDNTFGVKIGLRQLFKSPTAAELTKEIVRGRESHSG